MEGWKLESASFGLIFRHQDNDNFYQGSFRQLSVYGPSK
jgi:hypothetical protein